MPQVSCPSLSCVAELGWDGLGWDLMGLDVLGWDELGELVVVVVEELVVLEELVHLRRGHVEIQMITTMRMDRVGSR